MPLPSTIHRWHSAPLLSPNASPSRFPAGEHHRLDPIFRPLKAQLNSSSNLLSMTKDIDDPQLVVVICYPCYDDETLVPIDKLIHAPTTASWWKCSPLNQCQSHTHSWATSENQGFWERWPSAQPSPMRAWTAASLITGSPTTQTKRARPTRRALGDVADVPFETAATAGLSSSVSAPLPRMHGAPCLPVKYEDGGNFTQVTLPNKRSASAEGGDADPFQYIPYRHRDNTFLAELLMWYKPGMILSAYGVNSLTDDDQDNVVRRLSDFKAPGTH
ncbi:hypothetical protein FA95DRAFT_1612366 [Auriscalpium vulgare]|uniref:Uncharacterized protein n=1 Tax=Auriscalpium vulgare TaxID=40419 RepID=A0ACB8R721_9AGAM|nr:hypothetical protein FA95DRAFT_1612366 [Auriscalpium vulgare]